MLYMEYIGFEYRGENLERDMEGEIRKYRGTYVLIVIKEVRDPLRGLIQRVNPTNTIVRIDNSLDGEPNAQNSVLVALDQISAIGPGVILNKY